jgi:Na+/H+-dicarboxylate symporter/ABC-type amino acid transport substrate-binding protein
MFRLRAPTPFQRVILGLLLGVLCGLFVGEPAGALSIVGDAYIKLLQMTVLPYILVSLVSGLGSLDAVMARRIGTRGGAMILLLWGVSLATLVCLPLAYPDWTSAAFFSSSLVAEAAAFDPLALYLPANPFYSLGHGVVPAVVVFSIALGLALISVDDKQGLLKGLRNLSDALMRIASFVGKLAPIGIFAISAAAVGTLYLDELARLQVFLWIYLVAWAVLTFCTLPILVCRTTPFSYRQVLSHSQEAMVTAFATGTVLVVLPMIAERCKELLAEHEIDDSEANFTIDLMVPTAYSFPSAGTLLGLGFVLFAGWFVGSPLSSAQYPSFLSVGALVAFGSMPVAIPYLLDFYALPADLFQLYVLGSVVTARFATGLAAMHGVVVCLLVVSAVVGRFRLRQLAQAVTISIVATVVLMVALGFVLTRAIPYAYEGDRTFVARRLLSLPVKSVQVESLTKLTDADLARPRLDVIRERGSLRVGYVPDSLPFSYKSSTGEIVGFDMDMIHELANGIGVTLELMRLDYERGIRSLESGGVDIMVGGLGVTPQDAPRVAYTRSYIDQSVGLVMLDHRQDEFAELSVIRKQRGLRIAVPRSALHYEVLLKRSLPYAEMVPIDSVRTFFRNQIADLDAMAYFAETGSAWTLVYPDFSVAVPRGLRMKGSTAFALPQGQPQFFRFIDNWLELSELNGTTDRFYRHWILGLDDGRLEPHWSIMRNVLGWELAD